MVGVGRRRCEMIPASSGGRERGRAGLVLIEEGEGMTTRPGSGETRAGEMGSSGNGARAAWPQKSTIGRG